MCLGEWNFKHERCSINHNQIHLPISPAYEWQIMTNTTNNRLNGHQTKENLLCNCLCSKSSHILAWILTQERKTQNGRIHTHTHAHTLTHAHTRTPLPNTRGLPELPYQISTNIKTGPKTGRGPFQKRVIIKLWFPNLF